MDLIINRTLADVEKALEYQMRGFQNLTETEKTEWLSGLKGSYNYTDLNRVESAVQMIANATNVQVVTKTDWNTTDAFTLNDMERYLGNIRTIGGKNVPVSMVNMDYKIANQIEQSLIDLLTFIGTWHPCGEVYCGEV